MILVLSNIGDEVAYAVFRQLQKQAKHVLLVTAVDLVFAPYWRQEISELGVAVTEIRLQNGVRIESGKVQVAYNRLNYLEALHFLNATDRAYAEIEFMALYFSFLKSLGPALIRPFEPWQLMPGGLSELELQSTAIAAGVPVMDMHFTTSPRWMQKRGMIPMSPVRTSKEAFYKKSPNLVWEDKPLRQVAPTSSVIKVTVAGNRILCDRELPFEPALLRLAHSLGSLYMNASFGVTDEHSLALYDLDPAPGAASPEAVDAITESVLQHSLVSV